MGIPGLTKFINDRSDKYLKPFELRNTNLVIDGCNLSSQLYVWHTRSLSAFGGDYDLYSEVVRDFFMSLRKCNVTPIVIIDGGYERRKLNTIHKRSRDKMLLLLNFNRVCWTGVFFPLMLHEVFVSILHELDITSVTCFFEADVEIAAVARHFKCPVLSYDSDFFIYDVLYIPFNTVDTRVRESENGPYLSCSIYDVNVLIQSFPGLEKDMLPLLPALLGNDYIENGVFVNFFNHVGIKTNNSSHYSQRRIYGLLQWLRNDSLDSAIKRILSHTKKDHIESAARAINATIDNYKSSDPVILPLIRLESNGDKMQKPYMYIDHELIKKLPDKFIQLYQSGLMPSEFIDMINLNRYYIRIQVEDVRRESSQLISVPIIGAAHAILDALTGVKSNLALYQKKFKRFSMTPLNHPVGDCFDGIDLKNIMSEGREVKMNVMQRVLSLTDGDWKIAEKFEDWILFIVSLLFWLKNVDASSAHFHSIFLMTLANYIQSRLGYYEDYGHFMRCKAGTINRLSKKEIPVPNPTGMSFSSLLNSITELETLTFTQKFIKLRRHDREVTEKGYYISAIHLFASFQSVLKHVRGLNILMDSPFPDIKIQNFYSGTILYNLYFFNNRKSNILRFISDILCDMPNVKNVYDFILDALKDYIPEATKAEKEARMGPLRKR